jgi:hypothetical protein
MTASPPRVLVLGKSPEIMPFALSALSEAGLNAVGVFQESEAHEHLRGGSIEILAIGGGVGTAERQAPRDWVAREALQVRIVEVWHPAKLVEIVNQSLVQ